MLSLYHIQMRFPKQPQAQVTKFGTYLSDGSRYVLSLYKGSLLYTLSIIFLRVSHHQRGKFVIISSLRSQYTLFSAINGNLQNYHFTGGSVWV
jgi:hypothetical protein